MILTTPFRLYHVSNMQGTGEGDVDPSLDFASSSFDALKVLHTDPSNLHLPCPSVQPCDNLDAYESSKRLYGEGKTL